jgi:hypothetical protein
MWVPKITNAGRQINPNTWVTITLPESLSVVYCQCNKNNQTHYVNEHNKCIKIGYTHTPAFFSFWKFRWWEWTRVIPVRGRNCRCNQEINCRLSNISGNRLIGRPFTRSPDMAPCDWPFSVRMIQRQRLKNNTRWGLPSINNTVRGIGNLQIRTSHGFE